MYSFSFILDTLSLSPCVHSTIITLSKPLHTCMLSVIHYHIKRKWRNHRKNTWKILPTLSQHHHTIIIQLASGRVWFCTIKTPELMFQHLIIKLNKLSYFLLQKLHCWFNPFFSQHARLAWIGRGRRPSSGITAKTIMVYQGKNILK